MPVLRKRDDGAVVVVLGAVEATVDAGRTRASPSHCRRRSPISVRWIGVNVAVTDFAASIVTEQARARAVARPTRKLKAGGRRLRKRDDGPVVVILGAIRARRCPPAPNSPNHYPTTFADSVRWIGVNVAVTDSPDPSSPNTHPCPCSHPTNPRTQNRTPGSAKAPRPCRRRNPASNPGHVDTRGIRSHRTTTHDVRRQRALDRRERRRHRLRSIHRHRTGPRAGAAPDQPANSKPDAGVCDSVTTVPATYVSRQSAPQLMPLGELVTDPEPVTATSS